MRATQIGIGEAWAFVGVTQEGRAGRVHIVSAPVLTLAQPPPRVVDPAALDAAGYEVFVNPYGRVFIRPGPARTPRRAARHYESLFP